MSIRSSVAVILIWGSTALSLAQAPPERPKPGPEHKKLEYFVGTWKTEAEIKANAFVPAGKGVTTETYTLGPGGFYVEFDRPAAGQLPRTQGIMAYDSHTKAYTSFYANSVGMVGQAQGAKKTLFVGQSDFVMSQEVASKFSAEVVSRIVFDFVEKDSSEPEALRTRIETFLQKIERHEIDYMALPAYYPLRNLHVLAKVERVNSRSTIILFIPEVMDWKKTMSDSEFKYGLLIALAHEMIHLEMGHDQRLVSDKEAAKDEAEAWGKTILDVVRPVQAKGSPVGYFKKLSDQFTRANDNPSNPTWLRLFM